MIVICGCVFGHVLCCVVLPLVDGLIFATGRRSSFLTCRQHFSDHFVVGLDVWVLRFVLIVREALLLSAMILIFAVLHGWVSECFFATEFRCGVFFCTLRIVSL